jgi:hypothetical protein
MTFCSPARTGATSASVLTRVCAVANATLSLGRRAYSASVAASDPNVCEGFANGR